MIVQQLAAVVGMGVPKSIILSPSGIGATGIRNGVVYAGIRFQADGSEFNTPTTGLNVYTLDRGLWIDRGRAEDVWVQWVRTGGTLGDWNFANAGAGRLQLNVDREWTIERTTAGTNTLTGRFDFYNAASGGKLLAASSGMLFHAERT